MELLWASMLGVSVKKRCSWLLKPPHRTQKEGERALASSPPLASRQPVPPTGNQPTWGPGKQPRGVSPTVMQSTAEENRSVYEGKQASEGPAGQNYQKHYSVSVYF